MSVARATDQEADRDKAAAEAIKTVRSAAARRSRVGRILPGPVDPLWSVIVATHVTDGKREDSCVAWDSPIRVPAAVGCADATAHPVPEQGVSPIGAIGRPIDGMNSR